MAGHAIIFFLFGYHNMTKIFLRQLFLVGVWLYWDLIKPQLRIPFHCPTVYTTVIIGLNLELKNLSRDIRTYEEF